MTSDDWDKFYEPDETENLNESIDKSPYREDIRHEIVLEIERIDHLPEWDCNLPAQTTEKLLEILSDCSLNGEYQEIENYIKEF